MKLQNLRNPLMWLGMCLALALGGQVLVERLDAYLDVQGIARMAMTDQRVLIAMLALYIALLACPFVPGAEIGLLLLVLFGRDAVAAVYFSTVAAFVLSFSIGCLVPHPVLTKALDRLGLTRAAALLKSPRMEPGDDAKGDITSPTRRHWKNRVLRNRAFQLMALINTPGNILIGGGGGIAMLTGISRWVTFRTFLISVSIAVAPVPLSVVLLSWFQP